MILLYLSLIDFSIILFCLFTAFTLQTSNSINPILLSTIKRTNHTTSVILSITTPITTTTVTPSTTMITTTTTIRSVLLNTTATPIAIENLPIPMN